ncbi:MAG: HAMP domain-containing sensor histidine kinase [Bacteroidota bacterium]
MAFKSFRASIILRVLLISGSTILVVLLVWYEKYVSALIIFSILAYQIGALIHLVETTNRKLARFIESIQYDDFSPGFEIDNRLGASFKQLNDSLKGILELFRETRKAREENFQLLDTLVKYANVGLMAYDSGKEILFINTKCCSILGIPTVKSLSEMATYESKTTAVIEELKPGTNFLYRMDEKRYLSIYASEIKLQGRLLRLVSIQNIQSELQQKELEAWQNLTKVLRHEIMNSVTPISSLIETLNDIFEDEIKHHSPDEPLDKELLVDIREALQAIQNRSHALKDFVSAYRSFTQIPQPEFAEVQVKDIFFNIEKLFAPEAEQRQVSLKFELSPNTIQLNADQSMIEMVLINLVKNAIEACSQKDNGAVNVAASLNDKGECTINVSDNGPGIIPEAIEQVFIPFYSTKPTGSGIGLSLSRQIMQKHFGNLTVASVPDQKTTFTLRF